MPAVSRADSEAPVRVIHTNPRERGERSLAHGPIFLGTAGWSLPREHWAAFASEGSQLQRYAGRFAAVEINSSFYRPHRPATYAKWAESVPAAFRFCVKVPKQITHERRLVDCDELLARFLSECGELGEKLGCLLLQLPPSLALDPASAPRFVEALRARHEGRSSSSPDIAAGSTPKRC